MRRKEAEGFISNGYPPNVHEAAQKHFRPETRWEEIKTKLIVSGIVVLAGSSTYALFREGGISFGLLKLLGGPGLYAGYELGEILRKSTRKD